MREVNLDAGIFCQYRMLSHFTTLVIRERTAQICIKALQDCTKALCGRLRSAAVKLNQRNVTALALDQGANLGAVACPLM